MESISTVDSVRTNLPSIIMLFKRSIDVVFKETNKMLGFSEDSPMEKQYNDVIEFIPWYFIHVLTVNTSSHAGVNICGLNNNRTTLTIDLIIDMCVPFRHHGILIK